MVSFHAGPQSGYDVDFHIQQGTSWSHFWVLWVPFPVSLLHPWPAKLPIYLPFTGNPYLIFFFRLAEGTFI